MPIPTQSTIELYLLHEIEEMGGAIDVAQQKKELVARLRRHFPDMTDCEAMEPTPKTRAPKFKNNVEWARNSLVNRENYLDGSIRGRWGPITPQGREYLSRAWPSKERTASPEGNVSIASPALPKENRKRILTEMILASPLAEPFAGGTVEEFLQAIRDDASLRSRLRARLAELSDYDFEKLVKNYLELVEGLINVVVTQASNDRGVDLIGDRPSTPYARRIGVQAKKWSGTPIGSPEIQRFRGAIQGEFPEGIFVTLSRFSPAAIDEANKSGRLPVKLINGEELIEGLLQCKIGVQRHTIEVKLSFESIEIDEAFFTNLRNS